MSDPLDIVFVTDKDEAQRLRQSRLLVELAKYLDDMPMKLKPLFVGRFSLVDNSELAQLRADLQAAQERIAWLTCDIGESGLAAINRLIAACERGDIDQHAAPDLGIARDEILRQARQLDAALDVLRALNDYGVALPDEAHELLSANPAPEAELQP